MQSKKIKDKSKDEILSEMLNFHISKGNIGINRVSAKHKGKIKNRGREG